MPRIVITTDTEQADGVVLLDERVHSVHLSSNHSSSQLIERLAWAVSDAEDIEIEQLALRALPALSGERRGRRRGAQPTRTVSAATA